MSGSDKCTVYNTARSCTINIFRAVILAVSKYATVSHFHPRLAIAGKARAYQNPFSGLNSNGWLPALH